MQFLPATITLSPGDVGEFVAELQRRLILVRLMYEAERTGVYDDNTTVAVKNLQSMHGLKVDGIAGPATIRLLNGLITGTKTEDENTDEAASSDPYGNADSNEQQGEKDPEKIKDAAFLTEAELLELQKKEMMENVTVVHHKGHEKDIAHLKELTLQKDMPMDLAMREQVMKDLAIADGTLVLGKDGLPIKDNPLLGKDGQPVVSRDGVPVGKEGIDGKIETKQLDPKLSAEQLRQQELAKGGEQVVGADGKPIDPKAMEARAALEKQLQQGLDGKGHTAHTHRPEIEKGLPGKEALAGNQLATQTQGHQQSQQLGQPHLHQQGQHLGAHVGRQPGVTQQHQAPIVQVGLAAQQRGEQHRPPQQEVRPHEPRRETLPPAHATARPEPAAHRPAHLTPEPIRAPAPTAPAFATSTRELTAVHTGLRTHDNRATATDRGHTLVPASHRGMPAGDVVASVVAETPRSALGTLPPAGPSLPGREGPLVGAGAGR